MLTGGGYDCQAVVGNLRKARKIWTQMKRILVREGADPRILGVFFKAVVQVVFLFELETWVLTPCMEQALGSF